MMGMYDIQSELSEITDFFGQKGTSVVNVPKHADKQLESLVLCCLVERLIMKLDSQYPKVLDLGRGNHMPFRAATRGSSTGIFQATKEIINWVTPIVEISDGDSTYSIYREGSPFFRSRERPDILIFESRIIVQTAETQFGEETIDLNIEDIGCNISYSTTCNSSGPVERSRCGMLPKPLIGFEVSMNKSTERLVEQIRTMRRFGCEFTASVILAGVDGKFEEKGHRALNNYNNLEGLRHFIDQLLIDVF